MFEAHRIFDSHVHIFPDQVAAGAVGHLAEMTRLEPVYDGTRQGLLAHMRQAGVEGALNCPIATKPEQVESINRWAAAQNQWPVLSLGSVHPDHPDPRRVLNQLRTLGLRGVKMHPEYQQFRLDDPAACRVWAICQELDLLVLLHAGADIGFAQPFHSDPAAVRAMAQAYPRLRIVAAHFGGWGMWDQVQSHLIGTRVLLDLSFTLGILDDATLVAAARRHGTDRVLFGSDAPWRDQAAYVRYFLALDFAPEEQRRILWGNAASLLGFSGS